MIYYRIELSYAETTGEVQIFAVVLSIMQVRALPSKNAVSTGNVILRAAPFGKVV
jgi:hypothetical protein